MEYYISLAGAYIVDKQLVLNWFAMYTNQCDNSAVYHKVIQLAIGYSNDLHKKGIQHQVSLNNMMC